MPGLHSAARLWLSSCVALLGGAHAAAQSTPCGELMRGSGQELEVKPPDRAEGVALDASIVVRYPPSTDLSALRSGLLETGADDGCSREPICLFRAGGGNAAGRELVPGRVVEVADSVLAFVPAARLRSDTDYYPLIARPGFDRASRTELEFRTGAAVDREPPSFDPPSEEIRVNIDRAPPECDAASGSARVRVAVPSATDDGDEESVEILLFVTRAAGSRGPELRARAMNGGGEVLLTFLLGEQEAQAPVCVALRAVDGVGRAGEGGPSLCFDPVQGSDFAPLCGAAPGRTADGAAGSLLLLAVWFAPALLRRRARVGRIAAATRAAFQ